MSSFPVTRKRILLAAAAVGVLAAGYWILGPLRAGDAGAVEAAAPPPVEVAATVVRMQTVQPGMELPSRAYAYKIADIRPQVSGIVTQRLFEEGGSVEQGQQLYQIDPAPYKAVYDSAHADLNRTRTDAKLVRAKADRFEKLRKSDTVSQQTYEDVLSELEQATADVAVAEAAVAAAQVNLDYTKVSAPISGRIGKSTVTPGALATANQSTALATITQLDPIYVDLIMPSRDLLRLRPQFEADRKLRVSVFDPVAETVYPHEGELQFSEVTVDQTTGAVLLRALFPNPERLLLPGMFLRAQLHLQAQEALLVSHAAAVRAPDGTLSVWVIGDDNTVNPVVIETQDSIDNHWIVKSGLQDGDAIVTQGFQKIRPGSVVTPVFDDTASAANPE